MRILAAILLILAFLGSPASAEQAVGEQLLVPWPAGWKKVFHEGKGNIEVSELVPPDQSVNEWSEMLTVQLVLGPPKQKAADLLKDRAEEFKKSCDDVGAGPVAEERSNGYETAMRAIACTKSKQWGKGELSLFKAFIGRQRLYVVSRSWRGEPFEKEKQPVPAEKTAEWLAFMDRVVLCDTADPQRVCPKDILK